LVGEQRSLEQASKRITAAPVFRQQLFLRLQPFGNFIFPVDIVQNVTVNNGVIVGFTELVHEHSEIPQAGGFQQAKIVEVFPSQRLQRRRGGEGKPEPHIQSVTVMKRQRSPGAVEYLTVERLAAAPAQPKQQSLDVLACSQRVHRKVGTGTIVIEQARSTHRYPVGFVAGRAHGIISVQVPIRPGQNAHYSSTGPFATRRNLLFDYHEEPLRYRSGRTTLSSTGMLDQ
jgi:hypothetical protein